MKLYAIRAVLSGPAILIAVPLLYFRYHTLKYFFDEEGVSMSWGILFRQEINLTYARIQDIHISSGFLQRWLGLADIKIQTASGSAGAEMTLEGLLEFADVRDFLYSRMRGLQAPTEVPDDDVTALLGEIAADLKGARLALEGRSDV